MLRGRPADPHNIVSPNEIHNAPQMIAKRHTITYLARTMPDIWSYTQWCAH